ncbi:MAG: UDP-galactopyranose mutase [Ferruginibacter sp.]
MDHKFLIIGAGFSGSVLAQQLAENLDCTIEIWDERSHVGGNCHTEKDKETGIMVHQYGPHIFNTDKKDIWDYVNSFGHFHPYVHRVKANSNGSIYSLPVNLGTINQFFNKSFSPQEAKEFLKSLTDKSINDPKNFEEQALQFIGPELYKAFFYGYTKKQWGCEPSLLPASILKRIPVRFNYDDNYHAHAYTGIPEKGYTAVMQAMVASPRIQVFLNRIFKPGKENLETFTHVFYTGPLDAYFHHRYGRLGYRTVTFEKFQEEGDYQGTAQMNYCDEDIPYTRITEHKHFSPWQQFDKTIYFKEYSKETGTSDIPYYPKCLEDDKILLKKYREDAVAEKGVSFLGRLATYRYMDMHHVIGEALSMAGDFTAAIRSKTALPIFPSNLFL